MKILNAAVIVWTCSTLSAFAADAAHVSITDMQEHALSGIEKEIVPLAEAMPADKFDFAPAQGSFKGVRTFGQQMSHVAVVLNVLAAGMLGEKAPDTGAGENGPARATGKDAVVAYLKDAFAHAHRAVETLTDKNFTESVKMQWGTMAMGAMAELMVSHTFDHYGQAVVYARMNEVVPPASRS